jgi:hypothetical protein
MSLGVALRSPSADLMNPFRLHKIGYPFPSEESEASTTPSRANTGRQLTDKTEIMNLIQTSDSEV